MDEFIKEKIIEKCKKADMKIESVSISKIETGHMATDGFTSIMFDEEGNYDSLPMHQLYGNKAVKVANKGYSIYSYIILIIVIMLIIISIFVR